MSNEKEIAALNFLFQATQNMQQTAVFHRQCLEAAELIGKKLQPKAPSVEPENADS